MGGRLAGLNAMARNFKKLQEQMNPASRTDNQHHVRDELQRMALDELQRYQNGVPASDFDLPQSAG